jgi:hypothetical protein
MFLIRRLVVVAAILIALVLGTSAVLEAYAESQLADNIRRTFDLRARPTAEIDAFPILFRALQGRIPRVFIDARALKIQGLEISHLTVDMHGVHASLGQLLGGNHFDVTVENGKGEASVAESAVNDFLGQHNVDARVTLSSNGVVTVRSDRVVGGRKRRFEATGRLEIKGSKLVFNSTKVTVDGHPPGLLFELAHRDTSFAVDIPKLPGDLVPKQVVVTAGEASLVVDLKGYTLRLR